LFTDFFVGKELTQVQPPLYDVMFLERDPHLTGVIDEGRVQTQQEVPIFDDVLPAKELLMDESFVEVLPPFLSG